MTEPTEVDFAQLVRGSRNLASVATQLTSIRDALSSRLQAEGQSWGTDKPGTTHASGYTEQDQNVMDAAETKIQAMVEYADAIENASTSFVNAEDGNTSKF